METGPITNLEWRVLIQNSLMGFCHLQLTDTSGLILAKRYSGFESPSLRHSVLPAEKLPLIVGEIYEIRPHFGIIPTQTGLERADCPRHSGHNIPAFLCSSISSPTSKVVLGEHRAITNRLSRESHLTSRKAIDGKLENT
jgi:hypothetical protein